MSDFLGRSFDEFDYGSTRAAAQQAANESALDVGIERNELFGTWRAFFLPRPENRSGHELRCEVVRPERLAVVAPKPTAASRPLLVDTISVSQIQTWRRCQRQFGFRYVEFVPTAQSPSAALGQEVQDQQIDPWLAEGRPIDFSRPSGEIAQALVPMLPRPRAAGMEIRKKFVLPSPSGQWAYKGELDVYAPDSIIVPAIEAEGLGGVPLVGDVKTTSNLEYAQTKQSLPTDIQCVTYAWETMYRTGANAVDAVWWTVRTKRKPNTVRAAVRLYSSQVLDEFMAVEASAGEAVRARAALPKANDLPPNVRACDAYGGCPYRHLCNLSPLVQSEQIEMNAQTATFLDHLKARTTPAPIAGVPHPQHVPPNHPAGQVHSGTVTHPAHPAPAPGPSAFQQTIAQTAAQQGLAPAQFSPELAAAVAAAPAPVAPPVTAAPSFAVAPTPVASPNPINPPESALPPAPPVGVSSAAAAPTAAAPAARRGRPPASASATAAVPSAAPAPGIGLGDVEALAGMMRTAGIKRIEFDGQNVTALELV